MDNSGVSRRGFFRSACAGALGVAGSTVLPQVFAASDPKKSSLTPEKALNQLKEGNHLFLENKQSLPTALGSERRLEIARSQSPFAVLVSCSDSRVPPELLFGRGLGELFIVRNAGNTVDTVALGSIEYAIYALGVPLIVVLGHERCGAVDAALAVVEKNATYPGSIGQMIEPIIPAVLKARTACKCEADHDELLDRAVRENVERIVTRLQTLEPMLLKPLREGKLKIVGARYDLDDGRVEFFES